MGLFLVRSGARTAELMFFRRVHHMLLSMKLSGRLGVAYGRSLILGVVTPQKEYHTGTR